MASTMAAFMYAAIRRMGISNVCVCVCVCSEVKEAKQGRTSADDSGRKSVHRDPRLRILLASGLCEANDARLAR